MNILKTMLIFMSLVSFSGASQFEAFLNNGVGVNSVAMGQAYFNIADVESSFYNPALLSTVPCFQIKSVSNKKFANLSESYMGLAFPTPLIDIGVTYFSSQINNGIVGTSYNPDTDCVVENGLSHSYYTALLMLTMSKAINKSFMTGINIKQFQKRMGSLQAVAYAIDFGFNVFIIPDMINFSFNAINIMSTPYRWETENEQPEAEYLLGMGGHLGALKINAGLMIGKNDIKRRLGAEWNHQNTLFFRGGFDDNTVSTGFSLKMQSISFDYSYSVYLHGQNVLENTHRFGIGIEVL